KNRLRLRGMRDHANRAGGDASSSPNGFRERRLVTGTEGNFHSRHRSAARNVNKVQAKGLSRRHNSTVWSRSKPPSFQSVAETRQKRGSLSGQTSRTACTARRAKRMRFSSEPPYSSLRVLQRGDKNS